MSNVINSQTFQNSELDYHALNAKLNLLSEEGKLQLEADKEAVRQFFIQHANPNTITFPSLKEKIDYLIENNYYEKEFIEQYPWEFVKKLYKEAYAYNYRFTTFMGAFKYYTQYNLKTFDGKKYLERYEDRVVANALYLGRGNQEQAEKLMHEIMSGRYQPATPTFLNAGKAQRGELISCFKGDTNIITYGGKPKQIQNIEIDDLVLTHKGRYRKVEKVIVNKNPDGFNMVRLKAAGVPEIIETETHPVLIWNENPEDDRTFEPKLNEFIPDFKPNENGKWLWVAAANVKPYEDWVFLPKDGNEHKDITETEDNAFETEQGVFKKVVSLTEAPKETTVYNLVVEEDHTYTTEGITQKNCFLLRTEDNLESISRNITNSLQLSKRGGGVALNLTNLREMGAPIKQIEGQSSGIVPVMKLLEDSFSYANQLGARQGAGAVYLNAHHPDIMTFFDTKRENADEKIRIKTLSLGVVIPDITFELARKNEPMYLFSPYDVEREYGQPFSDISVTEKYYEMVENPNIRKKTINPREFFQTIAEIQFESGYPYLMFEDTVNKANPIHGKITMSNLCLSGDTRLLTDQGYIPFRELYETQKDFKVVSDNRMVNMNFEDATVSINDSTKAYLTKKDAEVYRITTEEGYEVKATEWHKFPVEIDGEIVIKRLGEIEIGENLLVQPEEGVFGPIHNPDLAYIAGVISSDGTFAHNITEAGNVTTSAKIYLYGEKAEIKETVKQKVWNILKGRDDLVLRQSTLKPEWVFDEELGRYSLISAPLAKLLDEYGYNRETKNRVPEFVWRGDRETVIAYLSGIFQMDSCISGSKQSGTFAIELGSIHKKFLQEIQAIMLNLGVYSRIYDGRKAGKAMLPDGHGGLKEYSQQAMYSLRVTAGFDRIKLYESLEWMTRHHLAWNRLSVRGAKAGFHKFRAHVKSIELYSVEDVYDVTVENGHSIIVEGVCAHQCSEILEVSTPSAFDENGQYKEIGRDISCNLGSLNVANAFYSPNFEQTIESSIRALTSVSELSNIECAPSVKRGNDLSHAVGLGQMNLHGFFAREFIHYDSPEAVEFTDVYFAAVRYYAIKASNKIAIERGETFYEFEKSKYADGSLFDMYLEHDHSQIKNERVKWLFAKSKGFVLPTVEDWRNLKESVMKHGIFNAYLQAVAPTGSISYITHSTSSIHPVTRAIETRKEGKLGRVYYPMPFVSDETLPYYKDAYKIGPEPLIDIYAAATKHVDQGLSLTLFFNSDATTRDLNKAYIYAKKKGIKTIYYVRVRTKNLEGTEVEGTAADYCESCQL